MKSYTNSVNKMMKNFDKELKLILEKDLQNAKISHHALIKNIEIMRDEHLKIA